MSLEISISRGGTIYIPTVLDGAAWETELDGTPGRFIFSVKADTSLQIGEGDAVSARLDGRDVFYGYVFIRRYDQNGCMTVTAYDQTRYLKNRDTYVYDGITASALLRRIAADHGLKTGTITDTGIALAPCVEDNKTLADIMRNALIRTEEAGGGRYVIHDACGALSLRKAEDLRRNLLICADCGQTFSRTVSIDSDTYNTVKLVCDSKSGRTEYIAADAGNTARWGKLQYFQKITDDSGGQKADSLLKLYNRERRELFVGGVNGDTSVHAGCSLYADGSVTGEGAALCIVERARHRWQNGGYWMDLTLTEV